MAGLQDNLFQNYIEFKRWGEESFGVCTRSKYRHYSSILSSVFDSLPLSASVLEIGFGNGEFLAFCRLKGWRIVGLELIEELVDIATAKGFSAVRSPVSELKSTAAFDLICAFDVVEHIAPEQLAPFLGEVGGLMHEGSYLVLTFPNGDSPFSLPNQNGDITHLNYIGRSKIVQASMAAGLSVVKILGDPIVFRDSSVLRRLFLSLRFFVRWMGNKIVEYLFLNPGRRIDFFSQNLVVFLVKD